MNDEVGFRNFRRSPFSQLLGINITDAAPDLVKSKLEVKEELCTRPALHGGAIMAFADNLGAVAFVLNLPKGARRTILESKINYLASIPQGETAYAETIALHKGRTTMVMQT